MKTESLSESGSSSIVSPPIPENEMERLQKLSELDVDYTEMQESLKGLSELAARVAGTPISLINLIDSFTQWTVANYGLPLKQMSRSDSVCQYTIIAKEESLEVKDLSVDDRFKDKFYVTGDPLLKYYFGVPLQTADGYPIGALCVLDKVGHEISPEKVEILKIIAHEIVNCLMTFQSVRNLQNRIKEANDRQRKLAHDIRGPLGGIISLAQIISQQGKDNDMDQVLEFVGLIQKSGVSLLELANEILQSDKRIETVDMHPGGSGLFNLAVFKDRLEQLYSPQAISKEIDFTVQVKSDNKLVSFSKNHLLQIAGNLISNAIKFTPVGGRVTVTLSLAIAAVGQELLIGVKDTGKGMDAGQIADIFKNGTTLSAAGTKGEMGYGMGLRLVKRLVDELKGQIAVHTNPGEGTAFEVRIPKL